MNILQMKIWTVMNTEYYAFYANYQMKKILPIRLMKRLQERHAIQNGSKR